MLSLLLQFLGFPPKLLFSLLSYFPFGVQRTGKFPLLLSGMCANVLVVISSFQHVGKQKDLKWLTVW
ncbi:hypothetical protein Gotri_003596, partial [Gossypium trilobum]|nr:hypothetical protein [Gossypium trilobum]